MHLALSIYILFNPLIKRVNEAKFLNTTFLPTFSGFAGASTHAIDIVPLTTIYASL